MSSLLIHIVLLVLYSVLVRGHSCDDSYIQCYDHVTYFNCYLQTANVTLISQATRICSKDSNTFNSRTTYPDLIRFYFYTYPISGGDVYLDIDDNIKWVYFYGNANNYPNFILSRTHSLLERFLVSFGGFIKLNVSFLDYLPNLKLLYLRRTQLDNFTFLQNLCCLEQLYLYEIKLPSKVVLNSSLLPLTTLTYLRLRKYSLDWFSITPNTFDLMPKLTYLEIGDSLERIYTNQFRKLIKLDILYLRSNPNMTIEDDAFAGMNSVSNYITFYFQFDLDRLVNTTFPLLTRINFYSCGLTQLNFEFFQKQPKLRTIYAPNELFHCDCDMQWTSIVSDTFGWSITGTCDTPSELNGKSITNSSNYVNCTQTQSFQCFNESFVCPTNSTCYNTLDSAYCDLNECDYSNGGCEQICHNTNGSYLCDCFTGYNVTNGSCSDIDECLVSNGGCNHTCTNTNGSFYCTCSQGYSISTDGTSCMDTNECTDGTHNCQQICVNTNGSYQCDCMTGYNVTSLRNCTDINECVANNGGCEQLCSNTNGSFTCSCSSGHMLVNSTRCEANSKSERINAQLSTLITAFISFVFTFYFL